MRRMQLGLCLITATLLTATPADAAPLQFSAVVAPRISGDTVSPRVGETLTEISAAWSSYPMSVEYQWRDCAPGQSVEQCTSIPGATGRSYTLQPSDAGFYVMVIETAHSKSGDTAVAVSPATSRVQPADGLPIPPAPEPPPIPLSYPSLSGTAYLGDTLTATPATWSPGTYTVRYQWVLCGLVGCKLADGATELSHTVTTADLNYLVALQATATAAGGTSYALSPLNLIARRLPATADLLKKAMLLHTQSSRKLLRHGPRMKFLAPGAGTVTITWTAVTRRNGKRTRVRVGRGRARTQPGHATSAVPFRFTRRGKALLRRSQAPRVAFTGVFTPADGQPATKYTKTVRLFD
jgi:hypothetical protein